MNPLENLAPTANVVVLDADAFFLRLHAVFELQKRHIEKQIATIKSGKEPTAFLSRKQACERLGITLQTLNRYCREEGLEIAKHKIGNRVLFKQETLDEWVASFRKNKVTPSK